MGNRRSSLSMEADPVQLQTNQVAEECGVRAVAVSRTSEHHIVFAFSKIPVLPIYDITFLLYRIMETLPMATSLSA